jgi:hypothetical protein
VCEDTTLNKKGIMISKGNIGFKEKRREVKRWTVKAQE